MNIGGIDVQLDGRTARWNSGMAVDGDGSPRCYAPAGSALRGLDFLANAGEPGNWYGVVCGADGQPLVQGKDDPCPGYFISPTALRDHALRREDPRSYVNSELVPYIAIPRPLLSAGVRLGDLVTVTYGPLKCGAIVADVGGSRHIGEGSIALAQALGMNPDPRRGGVASGVSYCIHLGTATSPPWPRGNVAALGLQFERDTAFV